MKSEWIVEAIETASWALATKPAIGWVTSVWTWALSFINWVMPYLQFISITLGILIWALTLYGMIRKTFKKNK